MEEPIYITTICDGFYKYNERGDGSGLGNGPRWSFPRLIAWREAEEEVGESLEALIMLLIDSIDRQLPPKHHAER